MIITCIKSAELVLNCLEKEYKDNPSEKIAKDIELIKEKINFYKESFKQMPEIENRLYYKIAYEGKNIMKACNEVANENYMNNSKPTDAIHIYKKYYKKIQNSLILTVHTSFLALTVVNSTV